MHRPFASFPRFFLSSLALAGTLAQAELVVNGSFESPIVPGIVEAYTAPSVDVEANPGWRASAFDGSTFTPGTLVLNRLLPGAAYDGVQYASLTPGPGMGLTLRQTVRVEHGATYHFSFAAIPWDLLIDNVANITWSIFALLEQPNGVSSELVGTGTLVEGLGLPDLSIPFPWQLTEFDFSVDSDWITFPANGTLAGFADLTLLLITSNASAGGASGGNYIDAVSLIEVPNPATLLLLLLAGLPALLISRR